MLFDVQTIHLKQTPDMAKEKVYICVVFNFCSLFFSKGKNAFVYEKLCVTNLIRI
jgi:hypothetical protein